jgi:hypothetical protein
MNIDKATAKSFIQFMGQDFCIMKFSMGTQDLIHHVENEWYPNPFFNESWPLLMAVVEKIESLIFYPFKIEGKWSECQVLNNKVFRNRGENKFDSILLTTSEFVNWWVESNPPNTIES